MKCQCCHKQEVRFAWQPLGPGEDANTFSLLGNHSRGFPVIKVCSSCKSAFQTGDFPVYFTYKGFRYVGRNHEVRQVKPSLWDGGTTDLNGQGSATMIMRDTPDGSELVALVADPAFVASFVVVPDLMDACEQITRVFADDNGLTRAQSLAVAKVRVTLKAINHEES